MLAFLRGALSGIGVACTLHCLVPIQRQPAIERLEPCVRAACRWGDISILDAEKALLREALKDPLNEK